MIEELSNLLGAFEGQMPDEPTNLVLINHSGGGNPTRSFGKKKSTVRYPSIQVKVRNESYFNAISKCQEVIGILEEYSSETIKLIRQLGDILPLGRENEAYQFSLNFEVMLNSEDNE